MLHKNALNDWDSRGSGFIVLAPMFPVKAKSYDPLKRGCVASHLSLSARTQLESTTLLLLSNAIMNIT